MKFQKRKADALAQATQQRQKLKAVKAACYPPAERSYIDVEQRIADWSAYVRREDLAYYRAQAAHTGRGATTGVVMEESTALVDPEAWARLRPRCSSCRVNTHLLYSGCFCIG